MEICNNGHREIVFDDMEEDDNGCYLRCPLCKINEQCNQPCETVNELITRIERATRG